MAEVFGGFVAGYIIALICTPLAALTMVRMRATSPVLARILPVGVTVTPLAVIIHGALFLFWTGIGMVLGLALLAMKDSGGAIGSLNAGFTLMVFALVLAIVAPFAILLRQLRSALVIGGVTVIVVFGVLMPYLAEWSKFDDLPPPERKGPQISWFAEAGPR